MKIKVNLELCQGHGRCQDRCPEVFGTDEVEGKCVILVDEVPKHLEEKATLGAKNCPEGAIRILRS